MISGIATLLWGAVIGYWVSNSRNEKSKCETNEHVIGAALIRSANEVRFALMFAPDCKVSHWSVLQKEGAADVEVRLTAKSAHFVESAA